MSKKIIPTMVSTIACLVSLTFAIPTLQWLASQLFTRPEYKGVISSTLMIFFVSLLLRKIKNFHFRAMSSQWKAFSYLALAVILGLLILNIQNQPVAKITGQARASLEVFDLIILLPVAEELVFRGAIWSKIERHGIGHIAVLAGTSLMFGIEHLGYWAQSNWPLPPGAYFHALSMVFAGVFFGFFRLKTDSLAVPAAIHMLANGVILLTQ